MINQKISKQKTEVFNGRLNYKYNNLLGPILTSIITFQDVFLYLLQTLRFLRYSFLLALGTYMEYISYSISFLWVFICQHMYYEGVIKFVLRNSYSGFLHQMGHNFFGVFSYFMGGRLQSFGTGIGPYLFFFYYQKFFAGSLWNQ